MRRSNITRCPVSCIVHVWTYSAAKATTRITRYRSARRSTSWRRPAALYRSIATFIRYGCASDAAEPAVMATNAIATLDQYGRRYCSSRRLSRASYALPRISSSCMALDHTRASSYTPVAVRQERDQHARRQIRDSAGDAGPDGPADARRDGTAARVRHRAPPAPLRTVTSC